MKLPTLGGRAPELEKWLGDMSDRGKKFRADIQKYNNVCAFTSIGMKQDMSTWGPQGIYHLRVNGRVGHLLGAFEPEDDGLHRFAQIYLLDNEAAVATRVNHILNRRDTRIGLDRQIVEELQTFLATHNYYARVYKTAHERFLENPDATVLCIRQVEGGPDPRRYNRPTENAEIAAVFIGETDKQDRGRDLWKQRRNAPPFRVSELHKIFLFTYFPLTHPHGEDGWHMFIPLTTQAEGFDRAAAEEQQESDAGDYQEPEAYN